MAMLVYQQVYKIRSWFITQTNYGYNYHKKQEKTSEIVVMFTNFAIENGGPTL